MPATAKPKTSTSARKAASSTSGATKTKSRDTTRTTRQSKKQPNIEEESTLPEPAGLVQTSTKSSASVGSESSLSPLPDSPSDYVGSSSSATTKGKKRARDQSDVHVDAEGPSKKAKASPPTRRVKLILPPVEAKAESASKELHVVVKEEVQKLEQSIDSLRAVMTDQFASLREEIRSLLPLYRLSSAEDSGVESYSQDSIYGVNKEVIHCCEVEEYTHRASATRPPNGGLPTPATTAPSPALANTMTTGTPRSLHDNPFLSVHPGQPQPSPLSRPANGLEGYWGGDSPPFRPLDVILPIQTLLEYEGVQQSGPSTLLQPSPPQNERSDSPPPPSAGFRNRINDIINHDEPPYIDLRSNLSRYTMSPEQVAGDGRILEVDLDAVPSRAGSEESETTSAYSSQEV
ncbi:hypothetical protein BDN72DRAFT_877628 [Pluteus cervinus]|uniref:Uncharacterized protein n=1 Tax=Pluteus cervinus TaxID=181527 RepID=A0ACD3AY11_9AGAR|nr:hypothetical protein BDN72DRAFT_877628 [Pluteus cervinus]